MCNTIEYRKANKLCVNCGKPLDREGACCIACNDYRNTLQRSTKRGQHAKGICVHCNKPLDRKGWFCTECNNVIKTLQTNRIHKRKAEGLCIQCGAAKAAEGRVRCRPCLDDNKIAVRNMRAARKQVL